MTLMEFVEELDGLMFLGEFGEAMKLYARGLKERWIQDGWLDEPGVRQVLEKHADKLFAWAVDQFRKKGEEATDDVSNG